MSVNADFYKFSKRKNSTKQPTGAGAQFSVDLKSGTSFISPTLLLNNSGKPDYNYVSFEGSYYFITDIISVRNDLWEIDCIIDPLATAKTAIINSSQYVCYSSSHTSTWLADTRIPLLQSTDVNSDSSLTGILSTIGSYVLTVVGENGCSTYITSNELDIKALLSSISTWELTGIADAISNIVAPTATADPRPPYRIPSDDHRDTCFSALIATLADMCTSLNNTAVSVQDAISTMRATVEQAAVETGFVGNAYANAPQCLRSCIWVPFDYALAPSGSGSSPIKLGNFDTGVSMLGCGPSAVTGSNTLTIPWHYTDWRRAICEDVYLYLPLVGLVPLSGDSITHTNSITVNWSATYTDGVITYKVVAGGEVIGSYGGNCAQNYPLGINQQASAGEVMNAIIGGTEKLVSGLIQSTISPISIGAAIAGTAATTAISAYNVENVKKSSHISSVGGVGGGAGIGLGRDCICYTVSHPTVVQPSDMVNTMGYPTMKEMSLATLTGYCQCANAHIEADYPSSILEAIDTYLNSGFYIE